MEKPTFFRTASTVLMVLKKIITITHNSIMSFDVSYNKISNKKSYRNISELQFNKCFILLLVLFLSYSNVFSQTPVPFTQRLSGGNIKIKGDIVFVGNNIINRTNTSATTNLAQATLEANTSYTGSSNNNGLNFEYMDVDSDPTTFSSSSAELNITNSCKRIAYAGLYWTATYPYERAGVSNGNAQNYIGTPRMNDWNHIKFKLPGGVYQDITADANPDPVGDEDDIIFNGYNASNPNSSFYGAPYVCYKNVTSLLQGLADANGNYFVANQRSSKGIRPDGSSAGWSLVIIYESPTLPSKYISIFDGYSGINAGSFSQLDFNVNGFVTLPAPFPVRASVGSATLEGDRSLTGDNFQIKSNGVATFTNISNTLNPVNNFFNSTITNNNAQVLNRNPASTNTLGFDLDLVSVNNPSNLVIPNNETGATFRLTTSGDAYAVYLTTFAVDIIEPKILLTKEVKDNLGNDASGANVTLGQELNYVIGFQNQGNDAASNFTIKDVLPINITFNPATDLSPLPAGVTYTYNASTGTIIFTIPNNLVEINDPRYEIRFKVKVVTACNLLSDACSNIIKNQAYATYRGVINPTQITDDPSLSSFTSCNLGTPQSTNFLVGVDDCKYTKTAILCGSSVDIKAANGYSSYAWSTSPSGTPVIGTNQTLTVTQAGTYYVYNTAFAPCLSIQEAVTVSSFGTTTDNPVIPYADDVVICKNDNKKLPKIFLCGAEASRLIKTGITDATSIVWEKLNEASCAAIASPDCANESSSCTWAQVGTGPDFDPNAAKNTNAAGQYRLVINYTGGCYSRFYFNVFQNVLSPSVSGKDIFCSTNGEITVSGVPAGYEYSLSGVDGTYVDTNTFSISSPNSYIVYVRQKGVKNACVFETKSISIIRRDFTVSEFTTQPSCYGDKGSIKLAANNVRGQYTFTLTPGSTSGLTTAADYTFSNLSPGTYNYQVTTEDGCSGTGSIVITEPPVLAVDLATESITCNDGKITVNATGGTAPYSYFIDSDPVFKSDPDNFFVIATPGTHTIKVVDDNNCVVSKAVTISALPKPVYTIGKTDVNCYGVNTGEIVFNVTNANGYTLSYSIDNGNNYFSNGTFSNLAPGTYNVILKYSLGTTVCLDDTQIITIGGPSTALTASAGVSELAGCGAGGEGKIRITNPQGGTPPYLYSFDNQASYSGLNEAYKPDGTYTVYIKDAKGCIYAMPNIKIDPLPKPPKFSVDTSSFNCDGTATSTVTVTNPGSDNYEYEYLLDNAVNPNTADPKVFLNVSSGPHKISVKYKLVSVSTYSNLLNEDFGVGSPTTSPGINANYCFEDQSGVHPVGYACNTDNFINDGEYAVTNRINPRFGSWLDIKDHTSNATNAQGRFLAINIGGVAGIGGIIYRKPIIDVIAGQDVKISFWVQNLINNLPANSGNDDPNITIQLIADFGLPTETVVASQATGVVPKSNQWENYNMSLNPGSHTSLDFVVRSFSAVDFGNDLTLDDISVYQLPISCVTQEDFEFIVPTDKVFTASITGQTDSKCVDSNDGTITIAAQNFDPTKGFEYTITGGAPWTVSMTSPVIISPLVAGNYNVKVRYDSAGSCELPLGPVEIKAPTKVIPGRQIFEPATCTTGATIRASATGGTSPYFYELRRGDGTVVTAFQNTTDFFNVPAGSYEIFVRDFNKCLSDASVAVVVDAAVPPTASVAQNTALCYDGSSATMTINITGGVGPFSYKVKFNSGAYSTPSATFTTPSFNYTATATGTYSFIVIDKNNCESVEAVQIISPKLTATPSIKTALSCKLPSPNGDATIEVAINGGTSDYKYVVKNSLGATLFTSGNISGPTFQYTTPNPGTYTFDITDKNNCTTTVNQTVDPLVAVTGTATVTNVTCFGADNGSVILEGLTGVPPFQFNFNSLGFSTTTTYSNLPGSVAGINYTYIVKDSKECTQTYTVSIKQPEALTVTASISTAYTCDGPATITAVADKGNSPYNYTLIRNGSPGVSNTTGVFTNLSTAGTYTVSVVDAKGCTFTTTPALTIVALNPPTAMDFSVSTLKCPANTVDVQIINVVGGTGTLSYSITAPASATSNVSGASTGNFVGLAPGTYTFQVKDANNCTYSKPLTINALPAIAIGVAEVNDVKCLGDANGSAKFTVSGFGNGVNYTYVVDLGAPQSGTSPATGTSFEIPVTGLNAGSHNITVTNDVTNCSVSTSATIGAPTAALALDPTTLTHVTCKANGTAVINAKDGWGTYTYVVTPTAPAGAAITKTTNTFTNLLAGDYSVTVTDLKGCQVTGTFTINDKVAIVASIDNATSDFCYNSTTGATIVVSPNTQTNYVYSINGGTAQSTGTFTGLVPNNYTVTITDTATGCTLSLTAVTIALPLSANTVLSEDLDCEVAPASPDAVIQVNISNGYPDYTYKVNTTGTTPFTGASTNVGVGLKTFTYTVATAGTYYFEIKDNKGCTTIVSRTINAKVKPDFTTNKVNIKCKGDATGTITVTGTPVTGTYTYSKDNGVSFQATNIFTGLLAGNYSIVVKDAKQCVSDAKIVTISEPAIALSASASVTTTLTCGVGNVSQAAIITVTASDGTPFTAPNLYRYSYNGGADVTSNTFTINTPGTVTIIVKDANGCTFTTSAVVAALNPPTALAFAAVNPITCKPTELDTDLKVTVTNGVQPFKFEITSTDAAIAPTAPVATGVTTQDHTFADLAPGTYFFKVTDANKCTFTGQYKIDAVLPIQAVGSVDTNVSCNGAADGKLKFTVSGNITPGYTYSLVGSVSGTITGADVQTGNTIIFSGLKGGEDYTFTVINTGTACQDVKTVTLSQPTAITAFTATATKVFCTEARTTITVSASGGTTPLQYAVVKSGVTPIAADYTTTLTFSKDTSVDGLLYDAYVKDNKGNCPQNIPVSVVSNAAPTINPPAVSCYSGSSFTVTITGSVYGGTSLFGIGTTPTNVSYNTNATKTITGPGTYYLGIKDDNGCTITTPLVVNDQLTIKAVLDKDLTCNFTAPFTSNDAQISLSATGGDGATYVYEYKLGVAGTYFNVGGTVYSPTTAGDYYFRVTSAGCSLATTVPVKVTTPVLPVITSVTETQSIKCNGDETAAISVVYDNTKGVPAFVINVDQYSDNTYTTFVKTFGTQTSSLPAGDYRVTLTDAKGCTDTRDISITQPAPIDFDLTKIDITCNTVSGSSLGSITVGNVTGGTGSVLQPFKYFITNNFGDVIAGNPYTAVVTGREDHTFTVINYGIYTINVVDANGCNFSEKITIASPPSDLTIDVTTISSDCISGGTAKIEAISAVGSHNYEFGILEFNTPPYTLNYQPSDVGFPDIKTFTNLTPGVTYTFVVHDLTTNCYYVKAADQPIAPASPLTSTVVANNITCKGANDGSVTFTIDNFDSTTTSITYQIFTEGTNTAVGVATTIPVTFGTPETVTTPSPGALLPGRYYVQFIENGTGAFNGCKSASPAFNILESSIDLSVVGSIIKNANCTDDGVITALAQNGTAPYKYQVTTSATAPLATDPSWVDSSTFNKPGSLAGITYYVYAKDAYGCIKQDNVILVKDPEPDFALTVPDNCAGEGAFTVDVTVTDPTPSMAAYSVSVNGAAFVSFTGLTYAATGLNSGLQTIIIKDKNGCPITQTITINATPLAAAEVTKDLDCSVVPTAVADATITVTVSKGTSPYTYEVKKGAAAFATITPTVTVVAGVTTFDYAVAAADADTYVFEITDANGCKVQTIEVIVDPIVPIVPDYTPTQPLCNGGTGSIEISATGGKGPYTYSFNSSAFTSETLYTIGAGTYTYIVRDALGCEETASATLVEPTEVFVGIPVITGLSCGAGNVPQAATVVLSATGGSGFYEYSFDGSAFTTNATYTVNDNGADQLGIPYKVKDTNGCEKSSTVDILRLDPPVFDLSLFTQTTITCAATTSDVTVSSTNGVGTLNYETIAPSAMIVNNGTNNVFTGLIAGDYTFLVTDANGCTDQEVFTVTDVTTIDIIEQSTTGITCSTATDGKASFFVSGYGTGLGTYHYEVDGFAIAGNFSIATIDLTGLAAGAHTIEVFDDETTCSKLLNFNIDAPATALALDPLSVTPLGCTTFGAVTITATGGWGDYIYELTQPDATVLPTNTTGVFGGLTQVGIYNIAVNDANGCIITDSFELFTPINPIAAIDVTSDYCYDATNFATLEVTASSTSPFIVAGDVYEYSIDNGGSWQGTGTFSNLTPGDYIIVVKDKFGCISTAVNTTIEPQLFASTENTKDIYCTGVVDGTITISAVGGYGSYTYTVAKDLGAPSAPIGFINPTDTDYTVTGPGSYEFVVYDAQGCSYTIVSPIVMVTPTPVTFFATPTSPSCAGTQGDLANGSILVTLGVANDNPDYTYEIIRTAPTVGTLVSQSTPLFDGLTEGTYDVTVTSGRACATTQSIVIAPPTLVVAAVSASPFTCSATNTINETIVTVTGTGGTGTGLVTDYTYSKDGTNWVPTNTFNVIDNGGSQTLTYYVKDANGCIDSEDITIAPFPKLVSAIATFGPAIDCLNNQQEMNVVISGGSNTPNPFTYQVYQDGIAFGGLTTVVGNTFTYNAPTAGHNYVFEIFDNNTTCSVTSTVYDVPLFNKMKVNASASNNVDCNGNATGAIEINITDYSGPYSYEIFKGGVSTGFTGTGDSSVTNPQLLVHGLVAGTDYTVTVLETFYPNCTVTSTDVIITEPLALDLSALVIKNVNQNCKTTGAVLTIDVTTISGGTSGYTYAFVPTGSSPVGLYDPSPTKTIATTATAGAPDLIDVYVKDNNGCFDFKTVAISLDPMPAITSVVVANPCAIGTDYRIDVVATGVGPLKYSIDGVKFQDDAFFMVPSSGDYTVTVMDANQCTTKAATALTILDPLGLSAEVSTSPTCNAADGLITLSATGGSSNYEYKLSSAGVYSTVNTFTVAPGTYDFYVLDVNTNCEVTIQKTIETPTDVTGIILTPEPVSCNGGSNGSIAVSFDPTVVNDNPIYTYSLTGTDVLGNAVTRGSQETPAFYNLAAGSYTVTVTSGKGCSATTVPTTVTEPALIDITSVTVDQFKCNAGTNGPNYASITVNTVTGGSTNYIIYEFIKAGVGVVQDTNSNVYIDANYAGGDYTINVYDDNNCVGTYATPIVIDPYVALDKINIIAIPITCRDPETITATAVDAGGTAIAGINYSIANVTAPAIVIQSNTSGTFTPLVVGGYFITAFNPNTGCSIQTVHYVYEPNTFELEANKTNDVICFSSNEGRVELKIIDKQPVPNDEAGEFTYVVSGPIPSSGTSNATGEIVLTNLTAGTYSVTATLTGSPYCDAKTSFTIDQPNEALTIKETHSEITCVSNNSGSISVKAAGGWSGGYEYQLENSTGVISPWGSTTSFSSLVEENYIVRVRDNKLCEVFVTVALVDPTPIMITASSNVSTLSCNGDSNATISVTSTTGGQGSNYLYTLNKTSATPVVSSGPVTSGIFTDLGAGTYTVSVTDGYSCSATTLVPIIIDEPVKVVASLVQATTATCKVDATLTLSATGGTAPYTYSADGSTYNPTSFMSSVPISVVPGTYQYYVRDSFNCVSVISGEVKIEPVPTLELNLDAINDVNCMGDATGVIVASALGGVGSYVYTLLDGSGVAIVPAATQLTPGRFTQLAHGSYQVRLESGDCDVVIKPAVITEPITAISANAVPTNVSCNGEGNGRIVVTASGGTGIIGYAISPNLDQFFRTGTFENLDKGFYDIIVQDQNGCYIHFVNIEIGEPDLITTAILPGTLFPEVCEGDKNGEFTIQIGGGIAPYSYSVDDINGTYTQGAIGVTDFRIQNLTGGSHTVYILDSNNCTSEFTVILPDAVVLNPQSIVAYDCVNNTAANSVTVLVDDSNKLEDLDFDLDGLGAYQASNVFANVTPGNHFVNVRHSNGCEKATPIFVIDQKAPLALTIADGDLNQIVATATGGSGEYQYSFNGEAFISSNTYEIYKSGDYEVTVMDRYGCTVTVTRYFEYIDICIPSYFTPNGDGILDEWAPGCTNIYKDLTYSIFDRYGRVIVKYHLGEKWNGKYKGEDLPSGDYWYVLKLNNNKDDREFVGHFTLYR